MELKVWVEGIQRIVCGVTEYTSCQDVVYALAHATAQTGRFTLVERWRTNERFLAPHESPVKILMKWGEYASEVRLILRRSAPEGNDETRSDRSAASRSGVAHDDAKCGIDDERDEDGDDDENGDGDGDDDGQISERNRDGTESSNEEVRMENIAIVEPTSRSKTNDFIRVGKTSRKNAQSPTGTSSTTNDASSIYLPHKKVRQLPPYRDPPPGPTSPLRSLPPYRDPPPPSSNSPGRSQFHGDSGGSGGSRHRKDNESSPRNSTRSKRNLVQEFQESKGSSQLGCSGAGSGDSGGSGQSTNMVTVAYTQRYVQLVRLVNRQRDTINAQQADLTKFDAEILYWETKNREQSHQMDFISQQVNRIESTGRVIEEQLKDLTHAEEESEIVRQQEKTLKSEITLLRSKLANCETELLQCKNKIRLVMEELASEQHNTSRESDERRALERKIMSEVQHLREEVESAKESAELANQCAETLKFQVANLEAAIVEKKIQVERLVTDMKEANLQSLTVACQDEQVKHLLEGAQKPGSTRKMIGSPRQLETAVPTSKNPHGVWV